MTIHHEAVREHLCEELECEDVQVHPLTHVDEGCFSCPLGVEGRLPRHREAVAHDCDEDQRVEGARLDKGDCAAAGRRRHLEC